MNAASRRTGLIDDRRGAMMIMGVFVSLFLVGAMWAIAGLGEAILMRERMQQASDAVALGAATINARGMNILVFLNLLMASVLSVRVMLNALIWGSLAAGLWFLSFAGIPLIGGIFALLAGFCFAVMGVAIAFKLAFDPQISATIQDICNQQAVIGLATAQAAAGGGGMANYYPEVVNGGSFAVYGGVVGNTVLPTKPGQPSELCDHSLDAVTTQVNALLEDFGGPLAALVPGADAVIDRIKGYVRDSNLANVFCELGSDTAPDPSAAQQNQSAECDTPAPNSPAQPCNDINGKDQTAIDAVINVPDAGDALDAAYDQQDSDIDACASAIKACHDQGNTQVGQKVQVPNNSAVTNHVPPSAPSPPFGGTAPVGRAQPVVVDPAGFSGNGDPQAQAFSTVTTLPNKSVNFAPQFVRIASRGQVQLLTPPLANDSFSQAEFFYDCVGPWTSKACNGPGPNTDTSMWNYYWRARLRPLNIETVQRALTAQQVRCLTIPPGTACTPNPSQGSIIAALENAAQQAEGQIAADKAMNPTPVNNAATNKFERDRIRVSGAINMGAGGTYVIH